MNEHGSGGPVSAIDAPPTRSMGLDADDLWWFDRGRRPGPAPPGSTARPSRPAIPAQVTPELRFDSLVDTAPDRCLVARFVSRCDPEALRTRFFLTGPMDRPETLDLCRRYLLVGPPDGVALLALCGQEPVGLLNLVPIGPRIAEAGVLVSPRWQRRGIARALVAELRRDARWDGWTMRAVMQRDNTAVRRLVRSLPGTHRTVSVESDCIEVDLHPFEPLDGQTTSSCLDVGPRTVDIGTFPRRRHLRGRLRQCS